MRRGDTDDKRLDVHYNTLEFQQSRRYLQGLPHSILAEKIILKSDRGDGPRAGFYTDDEKNGVPFIRTNNLEEHSLDLSDAKYITRYVHEKTLKRTIVGPGDLIIACTGDLGSASIIPANVKEANLNSALVRLEIDKTRITQEFFCCFFACAIARNQISFIGKGAAQHNLNIEEIGEVLIPLPPMENATRISFTTRRRAPSATEYVE